MAALQRVIFQIYHRPSVISSRCLGTSSKRRLNKADPVVDKILRVDHAGEVGANRIYEGQMAVLGSSRAAPVIKVYGCFYVVIRAHFITWWLALPLCPHDNMRVPTTATTTLISLTPSNYLYLGDVGTGKGTCSKI